MNEMAIIDDPLSRVSALRAAFDRSFAEPPRLDLTAMEDLLMVRVGDDVFAIRLSEIMGLYADKKITRVPGGDPALLGIAGFRGAVQPVYGLTILLGRQAEAEPRWLVIAAAAPVALAFDGFDGHVRVASETVRPREAGAKDQPYVRDFVPVQQFVRPILHLPSIADAIGARRAAVAPGKDS
ncbi:MAG TPA: chemotaxis protein CheW [Rhodopila sp.]|jgi:purine-binding chemotaxis protein CheW